MRPETKHTTKINYVIHNLPPSITTTFILRKVGYLVELMDKIAKLVITIPPANLNNFGFSS